MSHVSITDQFTNVDEVVHFLDDGHTLKLSAKSKKAIRDCRKFLDNKLKDKTSRYYGINTGFGSLHKVNIKPENLEKLQMNLVKSHAVGVGAEVPEVIVRLMLLLKVKSLSFGHSGVQVSTVERLIDMYNSKVLPVVYEQGSLGASGDLAPLAHLSLPLFGEGKVKYKGKTVSAAAVLKRKRWQPLHLKSKEGLALINGTQFMGAYASWCTAEAKRLMRWANLIAAMSIDAFQCKAEPFHAALHDIRNQGGQRKVAKEIRTILKDSELYKSKKEHVQDPYSFRCIPQVHGASQDAIEYVEQIVNREINAVTDNPNIFPEKDMILSGGNFHGQPLALVMDFLAIALSELGSISERRIFKLMSGERELPEFLINKPGLNSGLMMIQYSAAALVSQNKQLCTPASVDSITSSNGQEDHVSMGGNAGTKLYRVVQNVKQILAFELMTAAQALDYRKPMKSSTLVEKTHGAFRRKVKFNREDKLLKTDIDKSLAFIDKE